jgi:heptosyltransferase-2
MKILVRSPNWIGDCIMSLPALRALRFYFPDAEIGLACQEQLKGLFENVPEISRIITLNKSGEGKRFFSDAKQIRSWQPEAGILFTNSFHSALLFRVAGVKTIMGFRKDGRGILLNRSLAFPRPPLHQVDFYLKLIREFAREYSNPPEEPEDGFSYNIPVSAPDLGETDNFLLRHGIDPNKQMVCVSPATAYGSAKEWLPERFAELINRLDISRSHLQYLFFGSSAERDGIGRIAGQCQGKAYNLAGELSLKQAVTVISRCSLFIGNDSGLMHVASALGIPLVILFGPTEPELTAPRSGKVAVLRRPADCAPCKYRECPTDHRCMTGILAGEVLAAALELLPEMEQEGS